MTQSATNSKSPAIPTESPKRPLWKRALRLLGEAAITLVVVGLAAHFIGKWRAPDLPDQAPAFTLETLEGGPVSLADYAGQTVVLNFWATWCGPCRIEAPAFARFAASHPNVQVLGIAQDSDRDALLAAKTDLGINYPILLGSPQVLRTYGIATFPTTVVVGKHGEVLDAHSGIMLDPQIAWAARER